MEVDTGAEPSTIKESIYRKAFSSLPLNRSNAKLKNYDQTVIQGVLGSFETRIRIGNRVHQGHVYVVPDTCNSVLGKNFLLPLEVHIDCSKTPQRTITTEEITKPFPTLTSDNNGARTGEQHTICLRPEARPTSANQPVTMDLTSLNNKLDRKQAYWNISLAEEIREQTTTITPVYKKGVENTTVVDALSRLGHSHTEKLHPLHNSYDMEQATQRDDKLLRVMQFVQTQWPPKNKVPTDLRSFYQVREELEVRDGLLIRDKVRVVAPEAEQNRLLQQAHQGHPGIVRMKRNMRNSYWWPGMDTAIEHHVRQHSNTLQLPGESTLQPRQEHHTRYKGPFKKGQLVIYKKPHVMKGSPPYSKPKRVKEVLGNYTYKLDDETVWSARKLKHYRQPSHGQDTFLEEPTATTDLRRSDRTTRGRPPPRFSP
ncbi:MAG: hypothetical protein GY739_10540 [Mesoflavibacter sp.]|nr:hypothetical protein [Mesoflavibacter sp.]